MKQIKEQIPEILFQAIDESLPYGVWLNQDGDEACIELDSYLIVNEKFESSLRRSVEDYCSKLLRQDANRNSILDQLGIIYNLLKRQLEWVFRIKDSSRALYYTRLVYFIIVTLARNEKYFHLNGASSSKYTARWNKEKIALGETIRNYFNKALEVDKWCKDSIRLDVEACVSAIEIDLISLPALFEADASDLNIEEPVKTLIHAIEVLKKLPETHTISFPISYWLAKAHRHLAMANIKASRHHNALILLHISSIYLRYLDGGMREELTNERLRGFAELYKSLGNNDKANYYLEGTSYSNHSIAGYLKDPEEKEIGELSINICLIRHAERDSDEYKKFGFTNLTTEKGSKQQSAILNSLKRIINEKYSNVVIVSSEKLNKDAKYFEKGLLDSFESAGCKVDVTSRREWNPINVGGFRTLDERQASIDYPGEYSVLTDYRNGQCCGYKLKFPDGESVFDFERRIASGFSEILSYAIRKSTKDNLSSFLSDMIIVVLGHTSSVTACLNIIFDLDSVKTRDAYYKFYPIETGSIIYGSLDLKQHKVNLESRLPMVI